MLANHLLACLTIGFVFSAKQRMEEFTHISTNKREISKSEEIRYQITSYVDLQKHTHIET